MLKNKLHNRGFSILELSISLIVISMLMGGITLGNVLVKQSKLKSVVSDITQVMNSMRSFKSFYGMLPGDFSNASSFWSSASNGNGNGLLELTNEKYYAWNHLSLASLVPGTYNGTSQEAKSSTYPIAVYRLEANQVQEYDLTAALTTNQVVLRQTAAATGFMTPSDAYYIDLKYDDAVPSTGVVYTVNTTTANKCIFQSDNATYARNTYNGSTTYYSLGQTGLNCEQLIFFYDR